MTSLPFVVLRILADGRFHSGEGIARTAGVSRGSVWLAVRSLEGSGLEVHKLRGRGYRLAEPVALLDRREIDRRLGPLAARFTLEIVDELDSTNSRLVELANRGAATATVIVAEHQRAGRGRMGRAWHAAPGGALTFSLLWRFERGAGALAGLSLAVGVALARVFEGLGAGGAVLKWPNDVVWDGRKLAGILIEMQGDALGPSACVIGVGVNVRVGEALRHRVDQPVVGLETACGRPLDRNAVLARLLGELYQVLERFAREGFAPFHDEWQRRHVHQGRSVQVTLPDGRVESGVARGASSDGALEVEIGSAVRRYHSGEVSLRAYQGSAQRA